MPKVRVLRAARRSALFVLVASCYATGDPIEAETGVESGGYEDSGGSDAPLTFWISETTNFGLSATSSCKNTNLNQVGALAESTLEADGWVGEYKLNGQTTRRDFQDSTVFVGGVDHLASDNVSLAIYAGHGSINGLQWGNPDAGNGCVVNIAGDMRLGKASGDDARLAIFVTSCTMNQPNLDATIALSSAGQYAGWHNSPSVGDFVIRDFYETTQVMIDGGKPLTNRLSWTAVGQVKPGLGGNSPIIFTEQGEDEDVQARHMGARVSEGTGDETVPEVPGLPQRWTMVDNGGC